ncbi:WD repeat-containing protein 74-like isoform X2 [Gordionus sp. m RMFG-2023]|uniref:WD repeat-containing protein 74-like isoform X2 n=1 Tax=Gordionus sp. m RMFG-2023 TaxID=3053472 RepID=UPI0031FD8FC9
MAQDIKLFPVYIGTDTGIIKGINLKDNNVENIVGQIHNKSINILKLFWANKQKNKILVIYKDGYLYTYDELSKNIKNIGNLNPHNKELISINRHEKFYIVCSVHDIEIWTKEFANITFKNISCISQSHQPNNLFAIGGKENDLKIYNIKYLTMKEPNLIPIFEAKNLPNDNLDVRIPVWVTGIEFITSFKIAICTAFRQIRIYDYNRPTFDKSNRTLRSRPLISIEIPGANSFSTLKYMHIHHKHLLIGGDNEGGLAIIELKEESLHGRGTPIKIPSNNIDKISLLKVGKMINHKFIANKKYVHYANGSLRFITSIKATLINDENEKQIKDNKNLLMLSLDRYLRISDINNIGTPIHQIFLKSIPTCILIR